MAITITLSPAQAVALALAARGTLETYGLEADLVSATRVLVRAGRQQRLHDRCGERGAQAFRELAEDRPASGLHCCGRRWPGDKDDPASGAHRHLRSRAHAAHQARLAGGG